MVFSHFMFFHNLRKKVSKPFNIKFQFIAHSMIMRSRGIIGVGVAAAALVVVLLFVFVLPVPAHFNFPSVGTVSGATGLHLQCDESQGNVSSPYPHGQIYEESVEYFNNHSSVTITVVQYNSGGNSSAAYSYIVDSNGLITSANFSTFQGEYRGFSYTFFMEPLFSYTEVSAVSHNGRFIFYINGALANVTEQQVTKLIREQIFAMTSL